MSILSDTEWCALDSRYYGENPTYGKSTCAEGVASTLIQVHYGLDENLRERLDYHARRVDDIKRDLHIAKDVNILNFYNSALEGATKRLVSWMTEAFRYSPEMLSVSVRRAKNGSYELQVWLLNRDYQQQREIWTMAGYITKKNLLLCLRSIFPHARYYVDYCRSSKSPILREI